MTNAECIRQCRQSGDWSALLGRVPFLRFVGISIGANVEGPFCTLAYAERLVGNARLPALHGGTLAVLLETTATVHMLVTTDIDTLPEPATMTVNFLRSAGAHDTFAAARILKRGRRLSTLHVDAWQTERSRLVASASVHLVHGQA